MFADRTYQDNGQLTPRTKLNALIQSVEELKKHVVPIIRDNKIISTSNTSFDVAADTICIHGDGEHAVIYAKAINDILGAEGIQMQSITSHT